MVSNCFKSTNLEKKNVLVSSSCGSAFKWFCKHLLTCLFCLSLFPSLFPPKNNFLSTGFKYKKIYFKFPIALVPNFCKIIYFETIPCHSFLSFSFDSSKYFEASHTCVECMHMWSAMNENISHALSMQGTPSKHLLSIF